VRGALGAGAGRVAAGAAPLLVGAIAFLLARSVVLPGQGFWDTGEFQAVAPLFGTAHPTGYPTYVTLGWLATLLLAPLGEPALRMNLLSAVLLGVSAGLVVVLVRQLTGRIAVAVAAGLLLALTPIAWGIGGLADPHALHLALMAALLVVLVEWERRWTAGAPGAERWLAGAAVVYGVMLGNHTLTVLLAPGIALFVRAVDPAILRRRRLVLACAGLLLGTTAVLYLQLPLRAAMGAPLVYGRPDTWGGFWYIVLAAQFRGDIVDPFGDLGGKAAELARLAVAQLGIVAALVPAAFAVVVLQRPRLALLTGTWLGVTCWFAASYTNAVIDRYYLGPLLVVVVWLGIAVGALVDALVGPAELSTQEPPDAPEGVAAPWLPGGPWGPFVAVALAALLVIPAALAAPATAARVDRSANTQAADWSRWALATVEPDAVLLTWWSFSTPLWYRTLVLGERPDVEVVDDRDRLDEGLGEVEDVIRAALPARPVYLVRQPAELAALEARWLIEAIPDPLGLQPLYRVLGPRPAGLAGGSLFAGAGVVALAAGGSALPGGAGATPRPAAARMHP
jgi:hypothetical protein